MNRIEWNPASQDDPENALWLAYLASRAIAGYFDPVIERFERLHRDPGKRFYAARSQMQTLLYVAFPSEEKKPVEVLDSTCSEVHYAAPGAPNQVVSASASPS